jgi:hypothetical protein
MSAGDRLCLAYVLSRIGGDDGVSLEAMHWMRILSGAGFAIQVITGRVEASEAWAALSARDGIDVTVIAQADPDPLDERNQREFRRLFDDGCVDDDYRQRVGAIGEALGRTLDEVQAQVIIAENFTLPWYHSSLGLALAELIADRGLAAISRGHDFPHDRPIYRWHEMSAPVRQVAEAIYLRTPRVAHVAINTRDRDTYYRQMGIAEVAVIPNAVDVEAPTFAPLSPDRARAVRHALLGRRAGDSIALCPVRPVARKRLDVALELIRRLGLDSQAPPVSLLVSHDTKDAPPAVLEPLRAAAQGAGVNLVFASERMAAQGSEVPSVDVWDCYQVADFALYFSDFEGFGNALLECLACRLPVFVNEYEIYRRDIGPVGFDLPSLSIPGTFTYDDFVAHGLSVFGRPSLVGDLSSQLDGMVDQLKALVAAKPSGQPLPVGGRRDQVERHRALVAAHFSYPVVERRLLSLIDQVMSPPV